MKIAARALPFLGSVLLVLACGKTVQPPVGVELLPAEQIDAADLVNYQLPLQLTALSLAFLSREEKEFFDAVTQAKPTSFSAITQRMIQDQVLRYNQAHPSEPVSIDEMETLIKGLTAAQADAPTVYDAKVAYEAALQKHFKRPIEYNKEAVNLGYLLSNQQMQCFSGTQLQQILWRTHSDFRQSNAVILFTEGHTLPGFVQKVDGEWNLFGIETTVTGRGETRFGPTKDLNKPIVVVDAQEFAVFNLFKNRLTNGKQVARVMIERAAAKYGIDLTKTAAPAALQNGEKILSDNSSELAFGVPKTLPGSYLRKPIDQLTEGQGEPRMDFAPPDENNIIRQDDFKGQIHIVKMQSNLATQDRYFFEITPIGEKTTRLEIPMADSSNPGRIHTPEELLPITVLKVESKQMANSLFPLRINVRTKTGQEAILHFSNETTAGSIAAGTVLGME
jgi:hypothetical protein